MSYSMTKIILWTVKTVDRHVIKTLLRCPIKAENAIITPPASNSHIRVLVELIESEAKVTASGSPSFPLLSVPPIPQTLNSFTSFRVTVLALVSRLLAVQSL